MSIFFISLYQAFVEGLALHSIAERYAETPDIQRAMLLSSIQELPAPLAYVDGSVKAERQLAAA